MLRFNSVDFDRLTTETLVIPVCEDKDIHNIQAISSAVKQAKNLKEFNGKKNETAILYNLPEIKVDRVIFSGLGKLDQIAPDTLRSFAGKIAKECIKKNLLEILIVPPHAEKIEKIETLEILESIMEGAFLGNHIFNKYKTEKKESSLEKIEVLVTPDTGKKYSTLPGRVETVCSGTILAREWVSTPSNDKRPEDFTKSIEKEAKKVNLTIKIMDENELKQEKFGAILAVAAGSSSSPRLIILQHKNENADKTVVLVGKGITFDSGGINLKSSDSLGDMKMDMSGAAAVAATLITAAKLKLKINLIGVIPVVENMPSGNASRPGDIIKTYSGKTVEIGNTDAEGRLILIDAIAYSLKQFKPDMLIDMATLTGACVIALGEKIAGVFSPDDKLAESILESGKKTDERCWRLPLPEDYKELLKSEFADIHNMSSSRWGGAITAALFLSEFVKETKWAHIDIAGPAYTKKETPYSSAGGTGFGVRLFCDLLENIYQ